MVVLQSRLGDHFQSFAYDTGQLFAGVVAVLILVAYLTVRPALVDQKELTVTRELVEHARPTSQTIVLASIWRR